MFFIIQIILLFLVFPHFFAQRSDFDNTGLVSSSNTLKGSICTGMWDISNIVWCPDGTWAYGFQLTTQNTANLYGVLNIFLDCRNQTYDSLTQMFTLASSSIVGYTNLGFFSNFTFSNTTFVYCNEDNGRDYIRGYYLRMWCYEIYSHSTGVCEVKMHCSYNNDILTTMTTNQTTATWTLLSYCIQGYVACGYEIQYQNTYLSEAFFGMTDLSLQCCRICEVAQGFYLTSAMICDFCDISCLECYGTPTNCTQCLSGYTLTATNSCTTTVVNTVVDQEFFTSYVVDSTWTTNCISCSMENSCSPYFFIGGYNTFTKDNWIMKSMSGLSSHMMVRIRFHFFKIGVWPNGFALGVVDSVIRVEMTWTALGSPIYYNSYCGGSDYLQNVQQVDAYFAHSASTMTVNISTNNTGTGFWAISRFIVIIYNCDYSCLTCAGTDANQCTSCSSGSFLTNSSTCSSTCSSPYFADSTTQTCVTICPSPYFAYSTTQICVITCPSPYFADSTTQTCVTNCPLHYFAYSITQTCVTSCPSLYFADLTTQTCVTTCPSTTYNYDNNHTCLSCSSSCLTCDGPNMNQCLTCMPPFVLLSLSPCQCMLPCNSGFYYNYAESLCQLCDSACITCNSSGSQNCNSCTGNLYLQAENGPAGCATSCPAGHYPNDSDYTCLNCDSTCLNCSNGSSNACTSCSTGLFFYASSCKSTCPSGFYGDYSTNICEICNYISNCTSCESGYYMEKSTNSSISPCLPITSITPSLNSTTDALSFQLSFPSSNYSSIYSLYKNKTTVSIENITTSSFNFSLIYEKTADVFLIHLQDLTFSITNSPQMTINLNPPTSILLQFPSIQLTTYTLLTTIKYFYYIDSSTISIINSTAKATNDLTTGLSKTFVANIAISTGSVTFINLMVSMETIRMLRYLEISYPDNVLAIFNANLPTSDIIPNVYLDENSEDGTLPAIFANYNISLYVFNNNGNLFIEAVFYWFVGVIVLFFVRRLRNYKKKYVKLLLILSSIIFIWNYSVTYFLSNYLGFAFYTFLGYEFPTIVTIKGQINMFFSVFIGALVVIIFPFIMIKIQRMRLKIFPSNSNNESQKEIKEAENSKLDDPSNKLSPSFSNTVILENMDSPGFMSPGPKEKDPFAYINGKPNTVEKLSKMITRMRTNNMVKSKDPKIIFDKDLSQSSKRNFLGPHRPWKGAHNILIAEQSTDLNRYGTFHRNFNQKTFWQTYFIIWSLLKQIIYSLIIATSYNKPYEGMIVSIIFQFLFISTLFLVRPFKEKKDLFQNALSEFCGLTAMICAFCMANMERNNILDEGLKIRLGWGIVFANGLLIITFIINMIISWTIIFYGLGKECKKGMKKKWGKKNRIEDENKEAMENEEEDKGILDKLIEMEGFLR